MNTEEFVNSLIDDGYDKSEISMILIRRYDLTTEQAKNVLTNVVVRRITNK